MESLQVTRFSAGDQGQTEEEQTQDLPCSQVRLQTLESNFSLSAIPSFLRLNPPPVSDNG